MAPRYPVYIVSKGRWERPITARYLDRMDVPFRIVVEPPEYEAYIAAVGARRVLTLPFHDLGLGSIPARNWIREHAIAEGHARHWILDDNIQGWYRYHANERRLVLSSVPFRCVEDFADRYVNLALGGFHYRGFVDDRRRYPPFLLNTRIYSCILINHALPFRWRGRYNEDTDLSLRALKAGWCTIQFNAFLQGKIKTMEMKGGNTDELYRQDGEFDGRLEMARSLRRQHPDVVKITRKWGRWQHQVDYRPFKDNRLIRRPGVIIPDGPDEYGMVLRSRRDQPVQFAQEFAGAVSVPARHPLHLGIEVGETAGAAVGQIGGEAIGQAT